MKLKNIFYGVIVLNSSFAQICSEFFLPAIPIIALAFKVSPDAIQYGVTCFMVGVMAAQMIGGYLSDRLGRRPLILTALGLMGWATFIGGSWPQLEVLWLSRFLTGIGAGLLSSLFYAMARDLHEGPSLVKFGSYAAVVRVVLLCCAPWAGSMILLHGGWPWIFYTLMAASFVLLLLNLFFVPETQKQASKERQWRLIYDTRVWANALISGSLYGALIAWITLGSVLLQNTLGWSPEQYAKTFFITGPSFILGSLMNGYFSHKISDRWVGRITLLMWGMVILSLGGMEYMSHPLNGHLVVASSAVLFYLSGWVFPRAMADALSPMPNQAGLVSAFYISMRALGGIVSSAWIAHHADDNLISYLTVLSVCWLLVGGCWHRLALCKAKRT